MKILLYLFITSSFAMGSCNTDDNSNSNPIDSNVDMSIDELNVIDEEMPLVNETVGAKVISVSITGNENNYTFNVGVQSPDTGCEQYADWWEVITEEGELVYRRILAHSHVTEQPFMRPGSGINVSENQTLIIRAHMNTLSYGTQAYKGTISSGFNETIIMAEFANELETKTPLPDGCAF